LPDFEALMDESIMNGFSVRIQGQLTVPATLYNPHNTLHALLPPKSELSQNYQLRQRVYMTGYFRGIKDT